MGGRSATFILGVLLVASGGAATWQLQGSLEPDTPEDQRGPMFAHPPPRDGPGRVYFNAIPLQALWPAGQGSDAVDRASGLTTGGSSGVNPNLVPGARFHPHGTHHVAYLGLWRDCNGDGAVGAFQSALWRYEDALLLDPDACPRGTLHNKAGTVYEFLHLGYPPSVDWAWPGVVFDMDAMVWGDAGRVGAPPAWSCPDLPLPAGTLQGTGSLLQYADCHTGFLVAHQINHVSPDDLQFQDPRHPEEQCGHPLVRDFRVFHADRCTGEVGLLQGGSGDPAFRVWDCRGEGTTLSDPTASPGSTGDLSHAPYYQLHAEPGQPGTILYASLPFLGGTRIFWRPVTDAEGAYVTVPRVSPGLENPQGSYRDGLLHAERGPGIHALAWETCRTTGGNSYLLENANPARWLEGPAASPALDVRRMTDFIMAFGHSGGAATHLNQVFPREGAPFASYAGWYPLDRPHRDPERAGPIRSSDLRAAGPQWFTFYARIGQEVLAVTDTPPGGSVYGREACNGQWSGLREGWDCDAARWWDPDHGAPPRRIASVSNGWDQSTDPPTFRGYTYLPLGATPGDVYHLRDVDCLDNRPSDGGVPLTALSGEQCPAVE